MWCSSSLESAQLHEINPVSSVLTSCPKTFGNVTGITGKSIQGSTCLSWFYYGHLLLAKDFLARVIFSLIWHSHYSTLTIPAESFCSELVQRHHQTFKVDFHQVTSWWDGIHWLFNESACNWCSHQDLWSSPVSPSNLWLQGCFLYT